MAFQTGEADFGGLYEANLAWFCILLLGLTYKDSLLNAIIQVNLARSAWLKPLDFLIQVRLYFLAGKVDPKLLEQGI